MNLRKTRRGFTIVELVIVVAVIGVLAAILIPTFVNLTQKANKAADDSLVRNLNTALAGVEGDPDDTPNYTMHDAMMDLEKWGYKLENLQTRSNEKLLWNEKTNRFVLEDAKEVKESTTPEQFWKIVKKVSEMGSYSGYAHTQFSDVDNFEVHAGFDVGNAEISAFTYSDTTGKTVSIRTNSYYTSVTINAEGGTVNHYSSVGKVNVEKIDMNCYNEYGKAAYIKVTEGAVVAKDGGEIEVVFANNNDGNKVAVVEDGGEIESGYTSIQPVSETNESRDGGIALTYSIDGETAADMSEEQKEAALANTETELDEQSDSIVENVITDEVIEEGGKESKNFVARIGTTGYETLDDALLAARGTNNKVTLIAEEISLSDDMMLLNELVVTKDTRINLSSNELALVMSVVKVQSGYTYTYGGINSMNHNLTFTGMNYYGKITNVHITEEMQEAIASATDSLTFRSSLAYDAFGLDGANNIKKSSTGWETEGSIEIGFDETKTVYMGELELEDGVATYMEIDVKGSQYTYNWENKDSSPYFITFPEGHTSARVKVMPSNCGIMGGYKGGYISCTVTDTSNNTSMVYSWYIKVPGNSGPGGFPIGW